MDRRWIRFVWAGVLALGVSLRGIVAPPPAYACSCAMPGPPQEALGQSTAVFSGKVTGIRLPQPPRGPSVSSADPVNIVFVVDQVWKGPRATILVVSTPRESASCGYTFQSNTDYIVYARGNDSNLQVSLCSRTAPLDKAQEDLAALGAGAKPDQIVPEPTLPALPSPQIVTGTSGVSPPASLLPLLGLGAGALLFLGVIWFAVRRKPG